MEDHPGHALPALTLMIGGGGLAAITGPTAAAAASPSPSSTCRLGNGVSLGNTGVDLPTVFGSGSPEVAQSNADPDSVKDAEVVCNVNAIVQRRSGDEDTIAAVFCELDPHGWLHVISCGHPPPLLVTPKGARLLEELRDHAAPLVLGLGPSASVQSYHVDPGDRLLLYTDGLLECCDNQGARLLPARCDDCVGIGAAAPTTTSRCSPSRYAKHGQPRCPAVT